MSRGMKKFLPFASLKEQAIFLAAMQKEKQKVEKPLISDDTKEEINRILSEYHGETVLLYYYDRGFIKNVTGPIKKIDILNQTLIMDDLKVSFTNLLNVEIVD